MENYYLFHAVFYSSLPTSELKQKDQEQIYMWTPTILRIKKDIFETFKDLLF